MLLQPIVYLPDCEPVPEDPAEAIQYMCGWDYGEYAEEPERVDGLQTRYGEYFSSGDYVLYRYYDGAHALFRVLSDK